jgi:hypothetical protein
MSVLFSNNNENVTENDIKCKIIHIHFLFFFKDGKYREVFVLVELPTNKIV